MSKRSVRGRGAARASGVGPSGMAGRDEAHDGGAHPPGAGGWGGTGGLLLQPCLSGRARAEQVCRPWPGAARTKHGC